jgi:hypothetical protein
MHSSCPNDAQLLFEMSSAIFQGFYRKMPQNICHDIMGFPQIRMTAYGVDIGMIETKDRILVYAKLKHFRTSTSINHCFQSLDMRKNVGEFV